MAHFSLSSTPLALAISSFHFFYFFLSFFPRQGLAGNLGGPYNGLASTPQMGWDNWNAFGCNINETSFLNTAQKIVDYG